MAKKLQSILEKCGYYPSAGDEQKFFDQHKTTLTLDVNGNKDDIFKAKNIKQAQLKEPRHGNKGDEAKKEYFKANRSLPRPVSEQVEKLVEVLKVSQGAKTWIHDFVHSDDPKFADKSKKERIQMALGAFYSAKKDK